MILVKERENEQKLLISYLKEKNTILIKGVPGSGKTHTVLKTLELLDITNYQYFNCAYRQLKPSDLNSKNDCSASESSSRQKELKKEDCNERARDKNISCEKSGIVIIDEVDMQKNKLILYQLMAETTLILISNTLTLPTKLASRVTKIINFLPYTGSQMAKILGKDDVAIRRIVTGDLRRAINIEKEGEKPKIDDPSSYELTDFQKCKDFSEYASLSKMRGMEVLDYYEFIDGKSVARNLKR